MWYGHPKFRGYTYIANHVSSFDNYILLEYFVKHRITPTVTVRGSRVILMYDEGFDQRWIAKTAVALGFDDTKNRLMNIM